jgi:hypothetical protein
MRPHHRQMPTHHSRPSILVAPPSNVVASRPVDSLNYPSSGNSGSPPSIATKRDMIAHSSDTVSPPQLASSFDIEAADVRHTMSHSPHRRHLERSQSDADTIINSRQTSQQRQHLLVPGAATSSLSTIERVLTGSARRTQDTFADNEQVDDVSRVVAQVSQLLTDIDKCQIPSLVSPKVCSFHNTKIYVWSSSTRQSRLLFL